jgi:DNA-binding NarL/FixJ family response regulator
VVTFPADAVLAEARTHVLSIETVLRVVPSVHLRARPVTRLPGGQRDVRLSREEWELLVALGPGRTVAEAAADLGRSEYAVSRVLVALVDHGLVVVDDDNQ